MKMYNSLKILSSEVSSVRRLIATVRATPSGERPPKKMIIRHCVALFIGHAVNSAAILPLFPLQAGLGAFNSIMGPMLLAVLYIIAAITSCLSPFIVQILGANIATCVSHLMTIIFVGAHFYPKWYDIYIRNYMKRRSSYYIL